MVRLEQEKGITCNQALDAAKRLLRDNTNLEAAIARLQQKHLRLQAAIQEAEQRHQQLMQATEQAKAELAGSRAELQRESRRLAAYREEAERKKKRIDREVERSRRKANVTEQEIAAAGELKAEVGSSGFSLEQMLAISKEFAGYEDAREKVAEGLQKHCTLTECIAATEKEAEAQKKTLNSELANLRSQRDREQAQVNALEEHRRFLQHTITQLQADEANEQELRRFYQQYHKLSQFLDCLASWDQVVFLRCNNPLSSLANVMTPSAMAHFCTDKPPVKCPHCDTTAFIADEKVYEALNLPPGVFVKFTEGD